MEEIFLLVLPHEMDRTSSVIIQTQRDSLSFIAKGYLNFINRHVTHTGKENASYSRHRNTSFIERVMKQILTNMLLNLFTAIGAPLYVYAAECKQFGV